MSSFVEFMENSGYDRNIVEAVIGGYNALTEAMTADAGIKITVPLLKAKFDEYNTKYFSGKLPDIEITVNKKHSPLGFYRDKGNVQTGKFEHVLISISNRFALSEAGLRNLLVHEMLHMWYTENFDNLYPGAGKEMLGILKTFREQARIYNSKPSYERNAYEKRRIQRYLDEYKYYHKDVYHLAPETCHFGKWAEMAEKMNKKYPELNITPTCDLDAEKNDVKSLGRRGAKEGDLIFIKRASDGIRMSYMKPSKALLSRSRWYIEWICMRTRQPAYIAKASADFSAHISANRNANNWYIMDDSPEDMLKKGNFISLEPFKSECYSESMLRKMADIINKGPDNHDYQILNNLMMCFGDKPQDDVMWRIESVLPNEDSKPKEPPVQVDENGQTEMVFESVDVPLDDEDVSDIDVGMRFLPDGSIENTIS